MASTFMQRCVGVRQASQSSFFQAWKLSDMWSPGDTLDRTPGIA